MTSLIQESQKQLIFKIVTSEGKLNTVCQKQPLIFAQIIKVFNISQTKQSIDVLYKLKERLINLCLQEKQEFLQYLSLPKFKQISQHAFELLKASLEQISELIKKEQESYEINKIINYVSKYIPQCNSILEMENYHMKIFQLYQKSDICPFFKDSINSNFNTSRIDQNCFQNSNYSNFVKSQPNDERSDNYQKLLESSIALNQNQINFFEQPQSFFPSPTSDQAKPISQRSIYLNGSNMQSFQNPSVDLQKYPSHQTKNSSSQVIEDQSSAPIIKMQNSKIYDEHSQPLSNSQTRHKIFNVVDPNFKNCFCKGKIQKGGQKEFLCDNCSGKFHHQCLKLADNQEVQRKRKCPICCAQQIKNECFELIKPSVISSWIVHSKNDTVPYTIKLSEPLLDQIKKILNKKNHKIYLKLISIVKGSLISQFKSKTNEQPKTKSKQEIGSASISMQSEEQNERQNAEQESQMIDETQQINQTKQNNKNQPSQFSSARSTQTRTSIQLSQQYFDEIFKSTSPVISFNFNSSPQCKDSNSQNAYDEQRVIYYGVYEIRKKPISEIIDKFAHFFNSIQTNLTNQVSQFRKDQQKIINIVKKNFSSNFIQSFQNNISQKLPLKLKISSRKLRQIFEIDDDIHNVNIYPIRFSKCNNLTHVFELENYLESLYNVHTNQKQNFPYCRRISPDTNLQLCPICELNPFQKKDLVNYQRKENQFMQSQTQMAIYLDKQLYNLLNRQNLRKITKNSKKIHNIEEYSQQCEQTQIEVDLQIQIFPNLQIIYRYLLEFPQQVQAQAHQSEKFMIQKNVNSLTQENKNQENMVIEDYRDQQIQYQNKQAMRNHIAEAVDDQNEQNEFKNKQICIEQTQQIQKQDQQENRQENQEKQGLFQCQNQERNNFSHQDYEIKEGFKEN